MKVIIAIFFIAISLVGHAQMSILLGNLNTTRMTADQLLDITVSNSGPQSLTAFVSADLKDNTGRVVCSVNSIQLEINKGKNAFKGIQITENIEYAETAIAQYLLETGNLQGGIYQWCVRLTSAEIETDVEVCKPISSNFYNFLNLVYPSNNQKVETKNPTLTWTHNRSFPAPSSTERYELQLVEIGADQTPGEAIVENTPLLKLSRLDNHSIVYPFDAMPLEYGKKYAWQVVQWIGENPILFSDVWTFELREWEDPRDVKYVESKNSKQGVIQVYDSFYFRFDEDYSADQLEIKILNSNGEVITVSALNDKTSEVGVKSNGPNGYRLNLTPYRLEGGQYTISIINGRNEQSNFLINYNK